MRQVIVDTETTGLNYSTGDRIIEVGCVELKNYIQTGNNLQFYCSTEKNISEEAIKIHGLTNKFLNKQPGFKEQAGIFLEFIRSDTLIIHNAAFDIGFINNELKIIGIEPLKNQIIDTIPLARKKLNTRIANLDYLCRRFNIDLSKRQLHGALLDCQLLAEVYLELMGGKQSTLELNHLEQQPSKKAANLKQTRQKISTIKINDEEIKSHKNFTKNIKKAIWQKIDY